MRNNLYKATFWVMVITLISKVLGFIRETAIAANFGASVETDAFFVAFSIPAVLFDSISAAIATTFIPVYNRLHNYNKVYFLNNITTISGLFSFLLTGVAIIFAPQIVKVFAYGFGNQAFSLAVLLTRIMLLMLFFLTLNAVFTAYLQSNGRFLAPAAVGIPYNILVIIYLIFFHSSMGIVGFAWLVVIATVTQVLFLMPALLREKWKYQLVIDWKEKGFRQTLLLIGPVLLGTMVTQINSMVDRMLASRLAEGSISALNYANKVTMLTFGIIVVAIISVIYPKLSIHAGQNELETLKRVTRYTLQVLLIILFPIIVGGSMLASPIIRILFERGAFDQTDTEMTAIAFIFFNVGLIGLGLRELFTKVFFSLQDTRSPMLNGMLAVGLNIILNLILVRYLQHGGLALATSISFIVAALLQYNSLSMKIGKIVNREVWLTLIKTLIATSVMGITVFFIYPIFSTEQGSFFMRVLWLMVVILIEMVVYGIQLLLLREKIVIELMISILRKIGMEKRLKDS